LIILVEEKDEASFIYKKKNVGSMNQLALFSETILMIRAFLSPLHQQRSDRGG
jgi:hypothetical protein